MDLPDMVDSVKGQIVSLHPFLWALVLVLLQGTNRDGACCATFDHSDIRGFDRMTYFATELPRSRGGSSALLYSIVGPRVLQNAAASLLLPWMRCCNVLYSLLRVPLFFDSFLMRSGSAFPLRLPT
jgi:hypothetical protein